jgi:glucose/arabinose dehydrogenase
MKRIVTVFSLLSTILLVGCTVGTPTQIPTKTSTPELFIHVPTPTFLRKPTSSATLEPTHLITGTVTRSTLTSTPTLTPTATLTPTPTPTPTPVPVSVSELPDPSGYAWQQVVSGLNMPEGLVNAGDGSGRLFILEQGGLIRILKSGALLPSPFLDLTQKVSCCGERGLLGLVFHPKYAENGFFYVDYTEKANNRLYSVIARYSVSASDPNVADPNSELRLLQIERQFQNHNGGQLQFGPDGYLYIGMGDGGSEGDPLGNGQSLNTLLGKLLRLDVDHTQPYAIPPDNPYVNGGGLWEIWASGLRNPWRFSFDRLTGDLYIGDVGQDAWEEIDYLPAGNPGGENFGWSYYEGTHAYRGSPPSGIKFVMPVAEYNHALGNSVIGGYVYRGQDLPAWWGVYLYGDYGTGSVWGLLHLANGSWQNAQMFSTGIHISSFGVDENGEIYLVDDNGRILMLK